MKLFYRYWYGFEMSMAYLAGNVGDTRSMDNHVAMADRAWLKWWKEGVK